eukprot:8189462-Pyramimonas_sp.AAC.1
MLSVLVRLQAITVIFARGAQRNMTCLRCVYVTRVSPRRQAPPLLFSNCDQHTAVGDHPCGRSAEVVNWIASSSSLSSCSPAYRTSIVCASRPAS